MIVPFCFNEGSNPVVENLNTVLHFLKTSRLYDAGGFDDVSTAPKDVAGIELDIWIFL
jgi:hypothetical protein